MSAIFVALKINDNGKTPHTRTLQLLFAAKTYNELFPKKQKEKKEKAAPAPKETPKKEEKKAQPPANTEEEKPAKPKDPYASLPPT